MNASIMGEDYLGLFLYLREGDYSVLSVDASFVIKLINHDDDSKTVKKELDEKYEVPQDTNWGHLKVIKWDDLSNESKGFIKNKKFSVRFDITISKIVGFRKLRRVNFTEPNEPSHDTVLVIGGRKVYVSKPYLSILSPVFQTMFYGDFAEKNQEEIDLMGVDGNVVECVRADEIDVGLDAVSNEDEELIEEEEEENHNLSDDPAPYGVTEEDPFQRELYCAATNHTSDEIERFMKAVVDEDIEYLKLHYGRDDMIIYCKQDGSKKSALHQAAIMNRHDVVETLLACERDIVHCVDAEENTPLHSLLLENRDDADDDIISLLVEHGAKTSQLNDRGQSSSSLANSHQKEIMVQAMSLRETL